MESVLFSFHSGALPNTHDLLWYSLISIRSAQFASLNVFQCLKTKTLSMQTQLAIGHILNPEYLE